jgi:phospholipid-binding lipoprotein MlaA
VNIGWRVALAGLLLVGLQGCATTAAPGGAAPAAAAAERDPRDPLEGFNRAVFGFNEALDAAVIKPVAQGYRKVVPGMVRTGIDNFFGNLGDLWSAVNHLLQGKPSTGLPMLTRFGMNTLFGLGGLLDPASEAGLERLNEDFGQTLGRWGVPSGPYLVLPLFGPSTVRDGAARPVDLMASPSRVFAQPRDANSATVLRLIATRAELLETGKALDDAAFDKYILLRDGYLARRRNQVYDGDPPEEAGTDKPADNPK